MSSKMSSKMYIVIVLAFLISTGGNANADFIFGEPTNLGPTVNSASNDQAPSISADGLTLYFSDHSGAPFRPGGYGREDIWVTTRQTTDDPWGVPVNLGPTVNSPSTDESPSISSDGLSLYFSSTRGGGFGFHDLWITTRETKDDPWRTPVNLGAPVNSTYAEWCPNISVDGLSLYFCDYLKPRPGGHGGWDIYVSTRETISDPWGVPVNLGSLVNSPGIDASPNISADGLLLFLNSEGPDSLGADLYVARRPTIGDDWGPSVNLGPTINKNGFDLWPNISADGSTLYFASERPGGSGSIDLWQLSIEPVVDLNDDGIVDATDVCIIVDHWGTDEPLCDIGPMPWGDGIVDVQDLIVLAEHLFEDDRLVANWALDETEGDIAYDSTGSNHGTLNGHPIWQPAGGQYDGALEFDGIDDYVSMPFILNPAMGSFSAFAWIKGGAPGHVMISQTGGNGGTWLSTNPSDGRLMTGLGDTYFGVLESECVIADGQWHHIGLVYDFNVLHRQLYVDGAQVAEDATFVAPQPSSGGLHLGASKDLDATAFFSGLMDDVRIYNVVLTTEQIERLAQ